MIAQAANGGDETPYQFALCRYSRIVAEEVEKLSRIQRGRWAVKE